MFNVITSQEHHLYESHIKSFIYELYSALGLKNNQDLKNATFILLEEEIKSFRGGVLLFKQPLGSVSPEIRTSLETIYPLCHEFWTGKIAFQVNKEISGWDYEKISKLVYGALYEDLVAFGVKEDIPFLCLTMPLVEHLSINLLGFWHFRLEIKPHKSVDGLFHGLLSLEGRPQSSSDLWKFEGSNAPLPHKSVTKLSHSRKK